jgi:hypothetical protein
VRKQFLYLFFPFILCFVLLDMEIEEVTLLKTTTTQADDHNPKVPDEVPTTPENIRKEVTLPETPTIQADEHDPEVPEEVPTTPENIRKEVTLPETPTTQADDHNPEVPDERNPC